MRKFKFNGNWDFDLELQQIASLNSEYWFSQEQYEEHNTKLKGGLVPVTIHDQRNYDPDPTSKQLKTIDYIISNQDSILNELLVVFKSEINPDFAERCGEYGWIPDLNEEKDLGNLVGVYRIEVLSEHKASTCYYLIVVDYLGDEEHGLSLVLHENVIIGYSGIGDFDYECIIKDQKRSGKAYWTHVHENAKLGTGMVHKPLSKYGMLKPWQDEATEDYFRELIRTEENESLKTEIKVNNWDINYRFQSTGNNLVDLATFYEKHKLVSYLIDKGADISRSIRECVGNENSAILMKILCKSGASIDTLGYWNRTLLYDEIHKYIESKQRAYSQFGSRKDRLIGKKEMKTAKGQIKFYIGLGANPLNCDNKGNDYMTLLRKRFSEDYMNRHNALNDIKRMITPKALFNWKFWKN